MRIAGTNALHFPTFREGLREDLPLIVVEHIISYAHEPGLKRGEATERGNVGIGFYERVLSKVVTQLAVSQRLVQEEPSHR